MLDFGILATTSSEELIPGSGGWLAIPVDPMGGEESIQILKHCSGAGIYAPREAALQVTQLQPDLLLVHLIEQ